MNVTLVVPVTDQEDYETLFRVHVLGPITREFGGCTISDGEGWWLSPRADLVSDKVRVVWCCIEEPDNPGWRPITEGWWQRRASALSAVFDQETVFYCVDGEPRFSDGGDDDR
jgi:hypothetical protein